MRKSTLRWNKYFEETTGYSTEELSRMNLLDFFIEKDRKNVGEEIEEVFNKGTTSSVETSIASKSGNIIPLYLTGLRLMIDKKSCLVGMGIDTSRLKRAENALRESEERYRLLFNSLYDAIFVHQLSEKGVASPLIEVNDIACQKYGYTREGFLSLNPSSLRAPEVTMNVQDRTRDLLTNKHVLFEAVLVAKDGRRIQVEINAHLFELKGRQTVISIARDITERKRVEKALKESEERLELKNVRLEEANIALKVLLNKRAEDRIDLEKSVLLNVKELILPYLEKIKGRGLDETQSVFADILESNLNEIILPFTHRLSSEFTNLTPAEIKVANLTRQGKTTKEIADLMHLSHKTIESHRKSLRRKLGLKTRKENLRSRLLSIQ